MKLMIIAMKVASCDFHGKNMAMKDTCFSREKNSMEITQVSYPL